MDRNAGDGAELRLHLNEYRHPHAPGVAAALAAAAGAARYAAEYPSEETAAAAGREIAGFLRLSEDSVAVGAGGGEALRAAAEMFAIRRRESHPSQRPRALVAAPCYAHFLPYLRRLGYERVDVGLDVDGVFTGDGGALLLPHRAALEDGALVYAGSPNDPTGQLWGEGCLRELSARYPRSLFLVDEAYAEFAGVAAMLAMMPGGARDIAAYERAAAGADPREVLNLTSLAPLASVAPNLVVARTFSKAFGLAALRVGYAVGAPDTVAELRAGLSPAAVGALQLAAVRGVLAALPHYARAAAETILAAEAAQRQIVALGFRVLVAPANFFLARVGDAARARAFFRERGVAIRDLPDPPRYVRVTAGTAADLARVVEVFREYRAAAPPVAAPPPTTIIPKARIAALRALVPRVLDAFNAAAGLWLRADPRGWSRRRRAARRLAANGAGRYHDFYSEAAAATLEPWAVAGTLLGVRRHGGGQIPWDGDADFGYALIPPLPDGGGPPPRGEAADVLARPEAAAAFAARGLALRRARTGARWRAEAAAGAPGSPVHVDLLPFRLRARETLFKTSAEWACADPGRAEEAPDDADGRCNLRPRAGELFPLRDARYYATGVKIPAAADALLARALGPEWRRKARIRLGAGGPPSDFVLGPEDCRPA